MPSPDEQDEFERIRLVAQIEEHDDPHVQVLRDALRADHEAWIAEVQQWADDARAAGDTVRVRRHLAHVARLKAMPYP